MSRKSAQEEVDNYTEVLDYENKCIRRIKFCILGAGVILAESLYKIHEDDQRHGIAGLVVALGLAAYLTKAHRSEREEIAVTENCIAQLKGKLAEGTPFIEVEGYNYENKN